MPITFFDILHALPQGHVVTFVYDETRFYVGVEGQQVVFKRRGGNVFCSTPSVTNATDLIWALSNNGIGVEILTSEGVNC